MRKTVLGSITAAMLIVSIQAVSAGPVSITPPTIISGGLPSALGSYADTINGILATAATKVQDQANTELEKYDGKQENLVKGFGNANAYSAQAATLQGYQGYSLFAITGGFMLGAQLPSLDPNKLSKIPSTIADDPDVYAGIAPSVTYVNFGFNAEKVFGFFNEDLGNRLKHFYFSVKFGGISQSYGSGENQLDFSSTNFGLGVNYQWIPSMGVLGGFLRWRGINFGTGFLYQADSIDFSTTMDKISQEIPATVVNGQTLKGTMSVTPSVDINADIKTFSVPLEATTSVQLLWLLNLNLGLGADLVFGSSNINATSSSVVSVDSLTYAGYTISTTSATKDGRIKLDTGTDGSPELLRARVMTGFGMQVGPVKLDIPIYYYLASGLAVGVTGGIVW